MQVSSQAGLYKVKFCMRLKNLKFPHLVHVFDYFY